MARKACSAVCPAREVGAGPGLPPERKPVEQVWRIRRANPLSDRVIETCEETITASCEARNRRVALPEAITSIVMRQLAHIGQP